MSRSVSICALLAAAAALTGPATADDWNFGSDFRGAYSVEPKDWTESGDTSDSLTFETGIRYWYSIGAQSVDGSGGNTSSEDTAHIGELHLRVNDNVTGTFIKAYAGYSAVISGNYTGLYGPGTFQDGSVGYAGADFAWNTFGASDGTGAGPMVGYLYWRDAPNTGRYNFATVTNPGDVSYDSSTGQTFVPGDSEVAYLDIHALRLGVQAKAKLGDYVDVSGELAAVPYAKVGGVVAAEDVYFDDSVYNGPAQAPFGGATGNVAFERNSATNIDGWGYGAMAEGWLGIHPTENLTFRLGGRAWYLQGTADATYSAVSIGNPSDSDGGEAPNFDTAPTVNIANFIETANPFSLLRYGLLAELTYRF